MALPMISSMLFTLSSEAEIGLIPGAGGPTDTCLITSSGVGALDSFFELLQSVSEKKALG